MKTYLRKHVAEEIYIALTHFKHLEPLMDKYVFNDGTTKDLMSLSGTISTTYMDKSYNIPVCLWLEESYPQTAPICYVRPTRDMMVVRGKHVTYNGEVLLPYVQEWKHGECDLVSLLQVMVAEFGESPPVCMQPNPEPEQASCWLQFHRQPEVNSAADGNVCLLLPRDDGPHFYQNNETNC
ncbi:tumor susceptibility gene 101 protein [Genypterus blacodes]|uniref:tumor susceptibility gene 101 protein n=1 Tax=Genypterus blacodes TaxID=154954 RepID=UPI003F760628